MTNLRKKVLALAAACVMAGSVAATTTPAQAANNADELENLLAPTLAAIDTSDRAYYQYWQEYVSPSSPPASGDRYLVLSKASNELKSGRPYSYSNWFNPNASKSKLAVRNQQGRSETARYGGSWMLRSDMTGFLPRSVSRLSGDTIVAGLQSNRRLNALVDEIDGQSPAQTAKSIVDLGSAYPVAEGSLRTDNSREGRLGVTWQSNGYTSVNGYACDNAEIQASFAPLLGGQYLLTDWEVNGQCTKPDGTPVTTFLDGSTRRWVDYIGNAPVPNVNVAE